MWRYIEVYIDMKKGQYITIPNFIYVSFPFVLGVGIYLFSTHFSTVENGVYAILKIIPHWFVFFNSALLNYPLLTDELCKTEDCGEIDMCWSLCYIYGDRNDGI